MINFHFNKELNILEVKYEDEITINDIIQYGELIEKDHSLPRELKILTDVSEGNYQIKPVELPVLAKALEAHAASFKGIKAAFIQRKPKETAISYLMEQHIDIKNYFHKIFSTREAAIDWLMKEEVLS